MSAPLRVVAVVGTTRSVSKTKALVELIISRLAAHGDISAEVIEIHALTPGLGAAVEREQLDERAEAAIRATESADLLIDLANQAGGGDNITAVVVRYAPKPVKAFARLGKWFNGAKKK